MNNRYYYTSDRRSRLITSIVVTVTALLSLLAGYYSHGGYFMAWVLSLVAGVAGLYALSIPRYIEIGQEAIEIHCVLELTTIRYEDLVSIRKLQPSDMRYCFPLLGSYGFFGYYGYYYNLLYWDVVKVYAGCWNNFVELEDIYEQRYIVSCDDPDAMIADLKAADNTPDRTKD
ncbi:hypothetical protein FACS1894159_10010 [Bacteroidia bacterium]|nr:hypothetical protein FACS1894159_10010 [Bacteroidia bacterium]